MVGFTGRSTLVRSTNFTKHVRMDRVSWTLLVLVRLSLLFCLLRAYRAHQAERSIRLTISALVVVCSLFFCRTGLLSLYLFFEVSLIPIFFLVLGWGYQRERLTASKALFFYTFSSSIPLLLTILRGNRRGVTFLHQTESSLGGTGMAGATSLCIIVAFLVKLPIFGVHIWLPKAHVEAPVIGSIFLAAILLKIGGFGILKVYTTLREYRYTSVLVFRSSAWRFVIIRISCFQRSDMKVLIAFSSVRHMALILVLLVRGRECGTQGGLMIMLGHGVRSSIMFFLRYLVYLNSSTRSLILNKRIKTKGGLVSFMWCIACFGILGGPPTSNLWFEINAFYIVCSSMPSLIKAAFWAGLITGVYSLMCLRSAYSGNSLRYQVSTRPISSLDSVTCLAHTVVLLTLVTLVFRL